MSNIKHPFELQKEFKIKAKKLTYENINKNNNNVTKELPYDLYYVIFKKLHKTPEKNIEYFKLKENTYKNAPIYSVNNIKSEINRSIFELQNFIDKINKQNNFYFINKLNNLYTQIVNIFIKYGKKGSINQRKDYIINIKKVLEKEFIKYNHDKLFFIYNLMAVTELLLPSVKKTRTKFYFKYKNSGLYFDNDLIFYFFYLFSFKIHRMNYYIPFKFNIAKNNVFIPYTPLNIRNYNTNTNNINLTKLKEMFRLNKLTFYNNDEQKEMLDIILKLLVINLEKKNIREILEYLNFELNMLNLTKVLIKQNNNRQNIIDSKIKLIQINNLSSKLKHNSLNNISNNKNISLSKLKHNSLNNISNNKNISLSKLKHNSLNNISNNISNNKYISLSTLNHNSLNNISNNKYISSTLNHNSFNNILNNNSNNNLNKYSKKLNNSTLTSMIKNKNFQQYSNIKSLNLKNSIGKGKYGVVYKKNDKAFKLEKLQYRGVTSAKKTYLHNNYNAAVIFISFLIQAYVFNINKKYIIKPINIYFGYNEEYEDIISIFEMEFNNSETLQDFIIKNCNRKNFIKDFFNILKKLCEILIIYQDECGFIHRDFHTENILIQYNYNKEDDKLESFEIKIIDLANSIIVLSINNKPCIFQYYNIRQKFNIDYVNPYNSTMWQCIDLMFLISKLLMYFHTNLDIYQNIINIIVNIFNFDKNYYDNFYTQMKKYEKESNMNIVKFISYFILTNKDLKNDIFGINANYNLFNPRLLLDNLIKNSIYES